MKINENNLILELMEDFVDFEFLILGILKLKIPILALYVFISIIVSPYKEKSERREDKYYETR